MERPDIPGLHYFDASDRQSVRTDRHGNVKRWYAVGQVPWRFRLWDWVMRRD